MTRFRNRIQKPKPPVVIPLPVKHMHEECGHWCRGQTCGPFIHGRDWRHAERKCKECRAQDFNQRAVKQADPTIRHPEGG